MKIIKKVLIGIFFLMLFLFYNVFQFTKLHLEKNKAFNIIKLNRTNIKLGHRLPNAIIIGTPRSGSKVLSDFIELHPRVVCKRLEVHFFDRNYNLGLEWYRKQMPVSYSDQIIIEKTPDYFHHEHIPELVFKMNPNTKLLVIVRNPVVRAISEFTKIKAREGFIFDSKTYNSASKLFEETVFDQNGNVDPNNYYIKCGLYVEHLKNWLKYFPIEQIYIADGEKIATDPYSVIVEVEKFLGLDSFIRKENFVFSKNHRFVCVQESYNSKPKCQNETNRREHPFIPEFIQNTIKDFYKKYDQELFEMLNKEPFW